MSVCPFAVRKLIPPGANDPRITPRAGILHVADMLGPSLHDYFAYRSGGIESHFYIRRSGVLEQYRDTNWQADANLDANDFAVSVETEGLADGTWSEEQIMMIQRLMRWLNKEHSIPFRVIQHWDGSGWGYHTMWGAPSHWTPVAKTCPGPNRIKQFITVLRPFLNAGGQLPTTHPTPNIDAALAADNVDDRIAALKRVVKLGDDAAANVAASWLDAISTLQETHDLIHGYRMDLKAERG